MPRGVVNLLRSWWSGGRPYNAVVWKMVPLCIMWCLWSGCNERFFEDSERSLEDLLDFFLTTLFTWTEAWLAPLVISFSDFLSLFSSPLLGVLLYTSCILGLRPSALFYKALLIQKKKQNFKLFSTKSHTHLVVFFFFLFFFLCGSPLCLHIQSSSLLGFLFDFES
jgi:hypothetical protein